MSHRLDDYVAAFNASFDHAVAKVIPRCIARMRALAYGLGYANGKAAGTLIYRVVDETSPYASKPVDTGLYGPSRFAVESHENAMRARVAQLVSQEKLSKPTDEQWDMILVGHPATCVSAGAGSGKSTTLVLRVVFMLEYLGISDDEITVISFTKGSCKELRHTLRRVLGHWRTAGVPEAWALRRVRTFHSVLYEVGKAALPRSKFFENYGDKKDTKGDIAVGAVDVDNPMANSQLNSDQAAFLNETYRSLFAQDAEFRAHVLFLLEDSLITRPAKKSDEKMSGLFYAAQRDCVVTDTLNQVWKAHGWPFEGVDPTVQLLFEPDDKQYFYANGKDLKTGLPIVLGLPPAASEAEKKMVISSAGLAAGTKDTTLESAAKMKRAVVRRLIDRRCITIWGKDDLHAFTVRQQYIVASSLPLSPEMAPMFAYQVAGELKSVPIYEALFSQGSFIETLGFHVSVLLKRIPAPRVEDATVNFVRALGRFWPYLKKALDGKRMPTYNDVFLALAGPIEGHIPASKLQSMRHLLVDEFQDISPLIANWLKAMQRRLVAEDQALPVSIMAIGDDWQSIYGWRGSSPQLFIEFEKYFPTHAQCGAPVALKFTKNFRSVDPVVSDAMRLLVPVKSKVRKDCTPVPTSRAGDHGVELYEYSPTGDLWSPADVANHLRPTIVSRWNEARQLAPNEKHVAIVMTRRGVLRDALRELLPEGQFPGLRILTYHQAKGLEAETAILVEDCSPGDPYPLRNSIYAASGMYAGYSYDMGVIDEAYRLAYVGVTRGRRRVVWMVPQIAKTITAKTFQNLAKLR